MAWRGYVDNNIMKTEKFLSRPARAGRRLYDSTLYHHGGFLEGPLTVVVKNGFIT